MLFPWTHTCVQRADAHRKIVRCGDRRSGNSNITSARYMRLGLSRRITKKMRSLIEKHKSFSWSFLYVFLFNERSFCMAYSRTGCDRRQCVSSNAMASRCADVFRVYVHRKCVVVSGLENVRLGVHACTCDTPMLSCQNASLGCTYTLSLNPALFLVYIHPKVKTECFRRTSLVSTLSP